MEWVVWAIPTNDKEIRKVMAPEGTEIAPLKAISEIDNMDITEYQAWLDTEGVQVEEFVSSEWTLVGDKATLVGKRFVIAKCRFNEGKQGNFVSVMAFTIPDTSDEPVRKIVFNDGSTGVYAQLRRWVDEHDRDTAISCPKGLRVSKYTVEVDGVERDAETYYIA